MKLADPEAKGSGSDGAGKAKKAQVYKCPICNDPAIEIDVSLPTCCYVRFCKTCLLALPGAITDALAEYLP